MKGIIGIGRFKIEQNDFGLRELEGQFEVERREGWNEMNGKE